MDELIFNIEGQIIKRVDRLTQVSKSQNYYYASFNFSKEWSRFQKSVYFKCVSTNKIYVIILDESNTVKIPTACLRDNYFVVWCKGYSVLDQILYPTNMITIHQLLGGEIEEGEEDTSFVLVKDVVPRRLSLFDNTSTEADNNKTYLYLDEDGKDSKMSLFSLKRKINATTVKTSNTTELLDEGDYIFSEI